MTPPLVRAACLTAPAIGGIAVVQVVGQGAIQLLSQHLCKGNTQADITSLAPRDLRLLRFVDGRDVIDDALVCVGNSDSGEPVIDLNLHGGARIVQRVLLVLQREGVQIVEPADLLETCWPAPNRLHHDALALLLRAPTRRVALWLTDLPALLAKRIEAVIADLNQTNRPAALAGLNALLSEANKVALLVGGVRAVLIGAPNSGKSTLANTLAEREHAVVSDIPGTTRDWTEHPAAIDGAPFTIVDTAGLRETTDPLEAEAIRRAREQISRAHVIIRVYDLTQPPDKDIEQTSAATNAGEQMPILDVYNKADLPAHTAHPASRRPDALRVSARTCDGIDALRTRLLEAVGLPADAEWPVGPFTPEQVEACRRARELMENEQFDAVAAVECLQNLLSQATSDRRTRPRKV